MTNNDRYCTARIAELERQNEELRKHIRDLHEIIKEKDITICGSERTIKLLSSINRESDNDRK